MTVIGWPTEEAFYDADTRRPPSRERDFGNRWSGSEVQPFWRISYLVSTGELIAVRQGPAVPNPLVAGPPPAVMLIGWFPDAETCEKALAGWQARHGHRNGIAWIRQQARRKGVADTAVDEGHRRRCWAREQGAQGQPADSLF
jgi:hypothetical protein